MKILLAAINAKYIHSNLAVYSLKANAGKYKDCVELIEFSINHRSEDILKGIYKKKPDLLCFSCYIWNISIVEIIAREIRKVLPKVKIWLGGPEVSYNIDTGLLRKPFIDGIMIGEGEETFQDLITYYIEKVGESFFPIAGIAFKNSKEEIVMTLPRPIMDMAKIVFPYKDLSDFTNRILYYETSRGCPYQCSYCLSSIEKTVRFRPLSIVKQELQFFLDKKVAQVKFVDRTFNCNREHSRFIWNYLLEHDNGITNFHFEITADLLEEEDFQIFRTMRPGLIQLEIGVQSTNEKTMKAIHRNTNFEKLSYAVKRVKENKNIHQHLDLIAGLPWEDLTSFQTSFNDVYAIKPQQLQLGFLKVLKGASMEEDSKKYHIIYQEQPPYEVLRTDWLSYDDLLLLKGIEEMVEVYYNSGQFVYTILFLEHYFQDAFSMYKNLAKYYEQKGYFDKNHTRLQRFDILKEFFEEWIGKENSKCFCELLTYDVYLRENSKTRPEFAPDQSDDKEQFRLFYQKEDKERKYLKNYVEFSRRQLVTMTHIEHFSINVIKTAQIGNPVWESQNLLFDYRERDPLSYQAKVIKIEIVS